MLKKILMFLFNKSQSRVEMWLFIVAIMLCTNDRMAQGIVAVLGGSLIIALTEIYLKI